MGMGPVSVRKLAEARSIALGYRSQILAGQDPLDERDAVRIANASVRAKQVTFEQAASDCIEAKAPEWKNLKHGSQWVNTLSTYVYPKLGKVPINQLTTEAVYEVLKPIWLQKTETATRVRQRIEVVWDWAKARGYCSGENPARLKGGLGQLLPKAQKVKRVEHHTALPFSEIHTFMTALRTQRGVGPLALEFMILTATRTGEVVRAKWDEVDLASKVWTIPAARMKAGKEHRVPLSTRAVEILIVMLSGRLNDYVFASHTKSSNSHISTGAFLAIMKRMPAYVQYTPHGFRSTFRDWAGETTSFANETLELALAHVIGNQTEASYRRQDQLAKRQKLMQTWCDFIESNQQGKVVTHSRARVG
jgi:integrase